ncbi:MAG TPA: flagellar basal-body rod protein FlgF [Tepidisphaeraceae bacterium]|jgi:flagellar basal-body rod protein FlgF|nr:flagellar basal-body rod protein FlgF [Tepidisphaeraceae bacterium]
MLYGLYLSASGVMANSYRQDVLANNLANSETVGFKRDLALFQERGTALQEHRRPGDWSDPVLENIGGGLFSTPTLVDSHQGDLEPTNNNLDVAVEGDGFFAVSNGKETHLTRDGRFMVNRDGELIVSNSKGQRVLDSKGQPIRLEVGAALSISSDGQITQDGKLAGQIGLFDVPDRTKLSKQGGTMLNHPDVKQLRPATGTVHSGFVERSNVDPTTELAELMDAQRQLEANANMIQSQDQTLQKLVNEVGKIA